jgi:hypothetical protein
MEKILVPKTKIGNLAQINGAKSIVLKLAQDIKMKD